MEVGNKLSANGRLKFRKDPPTPTQLRPHWNVSVLSSGERPCPVLVDSVCVSTTSQQANMTASNAVPDRMFFFSFFSYPLTGSTAESMQERRVLQLKQEFCCHHATPKGATQAVSIEHRKPWHSNASRWAPDGSIPVAHASIPPPPTVQKF